MAVGQLAQRENEDAAARQIDGIAETIGRRRREASGNFRRQLLPIAGRGLGIGFDRRRHAWCHIIRGALFLSQNP